MTEMLCARTSCSSRAIRSRSSSARRLAACRLFRPVAVPLFTAYAGEFGDREDGDHPGGDGDLLAPRGDRVALRRQPPVEPVTHQEVDHPQRAERGPGRPALPGDDRAEAGERDREEDRPVRISGAEVDEGRGRGAEHHGHGIPLPPQEQSGASEEKEPRKDVELFPVGLLLRGEGAADEDEHGEEQRRTPRPTRTAAALFLLVAAVPPRGPGPPALRRSAPGPGGPPHRRVRCSSMPATLDAAGRRRRQPSVVITRTPGGVPGPARARAPP